MILFVGDSYGPSVKGSSLSHTHLEYRATLEDDVETRVLPFFIETPNIGKLESEDQRLSSFKSELQANHRCGRYARPSTAEEWSDLLEIIMGWITEAIWQIKFRESGHQSAIDWETGEEVAGISDAELTRLESIRPEVPSDLGQMLQLSGDSTIDPVRQPKALAASEQLREARLAIQIGERGIAQRHLREAVSIRPLDPSANEWLARVLLSTGKLNASKEAAKLAERAARIYEKANQTLRSSACLILAARAAGEYDSVQGVAHARDAVERTGWFAHAHLELARQLAQTDDIGEVFQELQAAFRCHPAALDDVRNEPAFSGIRSKLNVFIDRIKKDTAESAQKAAASEEKISNLLQIQTTSDMSWTAANRPSLLAYGCRASISRQLRAIQRYAYQCIDAVCQSHTDDSRSGYYVVDAGSLLLSAGRNIESVIPLLHDGDYAKAGQTVFQYRQQGSERMHEWRAPISMQVLRISSPSKDQSFEGHTEILRWIAVPRENSGRALARQIHEIQSAQIRAREAQVASENRYNRESKYFRAASAATIVLLLTTTFLSTPLAVISMFAALIFGIKAFSLWNRFREANGHAILYNQQANDYSQKIQSIESQIQQLSRHTSAMYENLYSAISEFEAEAIALASVVTPFPWIGKARKGDWVVASARAIESCNKKMGLSVMIDDPGVSLNESRTVLCRVQRRSDNQINLNREAAYFPLAA